MSQVNKMNKFQAITLNIKVDPFSSETEKKWLKLAKIVKNLYKMGETLWEELGLKFCSYLELESMNLRVKNVVPESSVEIDLYDYSSLIT